MLVLRSQLNLPSCPHCGVNTPNLMLLSRAETTSFDAKKRTWGIYGCQRCGGVVVASAYQWEQSVLQHFPGSTKVDDAVPSPASDYLKQAFEALHAPAGAVMLAASAVDAMLKAKGLTKGSLYDRIDEAVKNHTITDDMGKWAHQIRLDANDQRHADQNAPLPDSNDARRVVDFASALAQFMFVLPARVTRGLAATGSQP